MAARITTKAQKRTSKLRKEQHSHIRKSKPRAPRKEVQELLGVTSQDAAARISNAKRIEQPLAVNVNVDVDKLVDNVVERLKAESAAAAPVVEPEPITNQKAPPPSPVETVMLDLINVSEETEKLLHELSGRLAPVLKESNGDVVALGRAGESSTSVPLVDALRLRAGHMTAINGGLLDLLDRLAT